MTFREIDEALLNMTDPETGEIVDLAEFDKLQLERDKKIEGMALWVLDLKDEATALAEEIKRLTVRKESAENKAERLKQYLQFLLGRQKMKTPLVSVSFRESDKVDVGDADKVIVWAQEHDCDNELINYPQPTINKTEVKRRLKAGEKIPGVALEKSIATVIK